MIEVCGVSNEINIDDGGSIHWLSTLTLLNNLFKLRILWLNRSSCIFGFWQPYISIPPDEVRIRCKDSPFLIREEVSLEFLPVLDRSFKLFLPLFHVFFVEWRCVVYIVLLAISSIYYIVHLRERPIWPKGCHVVHVLKVGYVLNWQSCHRSLAWVTIEFRCTISVIR